VLLTNEGQFSTWLTGSPEDAFGLLQVSDPERMQIVQSGFEKEFGGQSMANATPAPNASTPEHGAQESFFDKLM
jgi:hypothetical protein